MPDYAIIRLRFVSESDRLAPMKSPLKVAHIAAGYFLFLRTCASLSDNLEDVITELCGRDCVDGECARTENIRP